MAPQRGIAFPKRSADLRDDHIQPSAFVPNQLGHLVGFAKSPTVMQLIRGDIVAFPVVSWGNRMGGEISTTSGSDAASGSPRS